MSTGIELFDELAPRFKNISTALDGLNTVIIGANFNSSIVWPAANVTDDIDAHTTSISTQIGAFTVTDKLEKAVDTLFEGAGIISEISDASAQMSQFLSDLVAETNAQMQRTGLDDRINAFNELNNPATSNLADPDFGFFPAFLDVINASAGTDLNTVNATNALARINGALTSVDAYKVFAAYVAASAALFSKCLAIGDKAVDDR